MSEALDETRSTTINAVKTPLGFLVLGFLIVDGTLATLAMALHDYRTPLVWAFIVSIPAFVVTVTGLAIWRPEALRGDRPLHETHANQFASDLFIALDGALSNLEVLEREEAWVTLADVITSGKDMDTTYSKFCIAVALRLKTLTNLSNRTIKTRGPVPPL